MKIAITSLETHRSRSRELIAAVENGSLSAQQAIKKAQSLGLPDKLVASVAASASVWEYAGPSGPVSVHKALRDSSPFWGPSLAAERMSEGEGPTPVSVPATLPENKQTLKLAEKRIRHQFNARRLAKTLLEANPTLSLTLQEASALLAEPAEAITSSLIQHERARASHPGYEAIRVRYDKGEESAKPIIWLRASGVSLPFVLRSSHTETIRTVDGIPHPNTRYAPLSTGLDLAVWAWEAATQVAQRTQSLSQAANAFGWRWDSGQPLLRFAQLPGVGIEVQNPEDTVTFFRGSGGSTIEQTLRDGLLANVVRKRDGHQELRDTLEEFLDAPPSRRSGLLEKEILSRKWEKMAAGTRGAVVGGSLEQSAAKNFGKIVYEIEVPREFLIETLPDGIYDEERESFLPFGVHPSWIKRVLGKDGTVLFDTALDPVQRVSDEVLTQHLTRAHASSA